MAAFDQSWWDDRTVHFAKFERREFDVTLLR
jgi:hypothetical protein